MCWDINESIIQKNAIQRKFIPSNGKQVTFSRIELTNEIDKSLNFGLKMIKLETAVSM